METKNLQEVLDSVGIYDPNSILADAHSELAELQRLASVVNGFVEGHSITSRSDVDNVPNEWSLEFMKTLCSIVGYKE